MDSRESRFAAEAGASPRPLRVLARATYHKQAASTRQRFAQYVAYLAEHGVEVTLSPLVPSAWIEAVNEDRRRDPGMFRGAYLRRLKALRGRRDYDLVWAQYELIPYAPGWVEALAARGPTPIVLDYDDAIFHSYDSHPNPLVRGLLGRKLEPLLSRAAAAMCGNAYLKAYAERFCPNSVIVPTVLDTGIYKPAEGLAAERPPAVGWIGSRTTWANVEPLLPFILPVLRAHGARLRVIGAGPGSRGIEGVDAVEWSEAGEVAELQAMDVGIMPLLDQPFQRGKCGYKLIQYMACGLPTLASPVGVNSEILADGSSGFLAASPTEWADRLGALLDDPALRARMGAEGRRIAVERYSLSSQQPRVLAILRAAAG
jgi:hypothetical protein